MRNDGRDVARKDSQSVFFILDLKKKKTLVVAAIIGLRWRGCSIWLPPFTAGLRLVEAGRISTSHHI